MDAQRSTLGKASAGTRLIGAHPGRDWCAPSRPRSGRRRGKTPLPHPCAPAVRVPSDDVPEGPEGDQVPSELRHAAEEPPLDEGEGGGAAAAARRNHQVEVGVHHERLGRVHEAREHVERAAERVGRVCAFGCGSMRGISFGRALR